MIIRISGVVGLVTGITLGILARDNYTLTMN